MNNYDCRLVYPKHEFHLVLQNSSINNEYYAVDEFQMKRLNIIQAKYGCRHCFHSLPDKATLDLNKFVFNPHKSCLEVDRNTKVRVQLNTLEEAIVDFKPNMYFHY
ncbi:MAG: hypothetical protein JXA77_00025 [Bacteroidales bacterium]|nr:hypothetical protein [Bacteroidales bacterium]MBN2821274.1 hypothetical protein [Bacteroidales bacterium]